VKVKKNEERTEGGDSSSRLGEGNLEKKTWQNQIEEKG